jgi:hypothetical protein
MVEKQLGITIDRPQVRSSLEEREPVGARALLDSHHFSCLCTRETVVRARQPAPGMAAFPLVPVRRVSQA